METNQLNKLEITAGGGINPNKECLTVERLKQFPGLENLTDDEAEDMVLSIRMFSKILLAIQPPDNEQDEDNEFTNYQIAA